MKEVGDSAVGTQGLEQVGLVRRWVMLRTAEMRSSALTCSRKASAFPGGWWDRRCVREVGDNVRVQKG